MNNLSSRTIIISLLLVFVVAAGVFVWLDLGPSSQPGPRETSETGKTHQEKEQSIEVTSTPEDSLDPLGETPAQETIVENLVVPWAIDFLPDDSLIFTERAGTVKLLRKGDSSPARIADIDEVAAEGEGGLLGIAIHPDHSQNKLVYVYYTYRERGRLLNKVASYKLDGSKLVAEQIIIDQIPGAANHNGGRIKFGPDGLLYITAGDSLQANLAQKKASLAGKILRVTDDGDIPADNPFSDSPVYSLGHRNPQGLAWDDEGRLWATEHGNSGNDEVNMIESGQNYGWPLIEGDQSRAGRERPVIHSGGDTWAPSGAVILNRKLFFTGLRGQALLSIDTQNPAQPARHFANEFGRLRDVVVGPDGLLYVATSNRDGRGRPFFVDDRIIKLDPDKL